MNLIDVGFTLHFFILSERKLAQLIVNIVEQVSEESEVVLAEPLGKEYRLENG